MVLPGTEATVRLADVLTSCWSALRAEDNPLSLAPVSKPRFSLWMAWVPTI